MILLIYSRYGAMVTLKTKICYLEILDLHLQSFVCTVSTDLQAKVSDYSTWKLKRETCLMQISQHIAKASSWGNPQSDVHTAEVRFDGVLIHFEGL